MITIIDKDGVIHMLKQDDVWEYKTFLKQLYVKTATSEWITVRKVRIGQGKYITVSSVDDFLDALNYVDEMSVW